MLFCDWKIMATSLPYFGVKPSCVCLMFTYINLKTQVLILLVSQINFMFTQILIFIRFTLFIRFTSHYFHYNVNKFALLPWLLSWCPALCWRCSWWPDVQPLRHETPPPPGETVDTAPSNSSPLETPCTWPRILAQWWWFLFGGRIVRFSGFHLHLHLWRQSLTFLL